METSHVLKLSDTSVTLETVGGKGMSLSKMIQAGFPVPDGFHITNEAVTEKFPKTSPPPSPLHTPNFVL